MQFLGAETGNPGAEARGDRGEELEGVAEGSGGEGGEAGQVQAVGCDRDGVAGEEGGGGAAAVHRHVRVPPRADQNQGGVLAQDQENADRVRNRRASIVDSTVCMPGIGMYINTN